MTNSTFNQDNLPPQQIQIQNELGKFITSEQIRYVRNHLLQRGRHLVIRLKSSKWLVVAFGTGSTQKCKGKNTKSHTFIHK